MTPMLPDPIHASRALLLARPPVAKRRFNRAERGCLRAKEIPAQPPLRWRAGSGTAWRVRSATGSLDLLIGALGLADDFDEQAAVDESVGDGGSRSGVVEELAPILERQICGHYRGRPLIPAIEHLVEEVGAAGVEAQVAELVDLCAAPHKSTHVEHLVMWSPRADSQEFS